MIEVRFAHHDDLAGLLPLMAQLGYPCTPEELESYFYSFIAFDGHRIAVTCDESKIIVCIAWTTKNVFVVNKTRFHLEGIVVDECYRGQGIGRKLMTFLEEIAKEFGSVIIDLCTGLRRSKEGTHEFYRKLGYANEGPMVKLYLRKELHP
ncbi:MAG: GNAT family N-acetyltransferase [Chthoniobacterales bacterium]